MGKQVFEFLLSELKFMSIVCKNQACGAVIRIPLAQAEKTLAQVKCPVCRQTFKTKEENPLALLVVAMNKIAAIKDRVDVQFSLPSQASGEE